MRDKPLIQAICEHIKASYLDEQHPSFHFVSDRVRCGLYQPVMQKIEQYVALKDVTDLNHDVCLSYELHSRALRWGLCLSLVGPYATLGAWRSNRWKRNQAHRARACEVEAALQVDLQQAGVSILSDEILQTKLPISITSDFIDTEHNNIVYNLLFYPDM
ncbi:hypothetical protein CUZ56_00499 [Saezia sanguinis]|uniref:Uncharacterized protein n=1 Tax=Saezia sanguinis TaxID=1965230 RepID=A0A433SH37_9BURK|nr:hypothetical protein [Saezia sanguinis]RUS68016.1 hypothetical protein CUZ56_00499 [Saezia sanguinis]